MNAKPKIFVSATTDEFERERDVVAQLLDTFGYDVIFHETVCQRTDSLTVLQRLNAYIAECESVLFIVGHEAGTIATEADSKIRETYLPPKWSEASFTQWEFFLATMPELLVHEIKCPFLLFVLNEDIQMAKKTGPPASRSLQSKFRRFLLEEQNVDRDLFSNQLELIAQVIQARRKKFPRRIGTRPYYLPIPPGSVCIGRDDFLEQIHQSYLKQKNQRPLAVVTIAGPGGVGKTSVVKTYADQHFADFSAILFAECKSPDDLTEALAGFADTPILNLNDDGHTDRRLLEDRTIRWFKENRDWLLILDNIDDEKTANAVNSFASHLRGGFVLCTGRFEFAASARPFELPPIPVQDARKFIIDQTGHSRTCADDDRRAAEELAERLGGHPLAL